jgi:hypothetical protein
LILCRSALASDPATNSHQENRKRVYLVQRGTRAVGGLVVPFWLPLKPFEPAKVITLLKRPRLANSARLSKYRNDNLWPRGGCRSPHPVGAPAVRERPRSIRVIAPT